MLNDLILSRSKRVTVLTGLLLLLVSCNSLLAQRKLKDYFITGSAMLASGMLDGTIESISFHYEKGFKRRLPNTNDQFWDPSISWKNKYKYGNSEMGPRFAGSTNIFVCTTDGYHMLRTAKRSIEALSIAYYVNKSCHEGPGKRKRWKNVLTDFLVLSAIRCVGFNLTYAVAFNPGRSYFKM